MNIRHRIAVSVIGGLLVATALVGTAVAVPQMLGRQAEGRDSMMRAQGISRQADRPGHEDMQSFMDQYRTSDGRIDVDRMHQDLNRDNNVTPRGEMRRGPAPTDGFWGSGMMGR